MSQKPVVCDSNSRKVTYQVDCDSEYWEVPVCSLSDVKYPNRDHAYILPDDSIWVLSFDGNYFINLRRGGDGEGADPTLIYNDDGYLKIDGSGTYEVTVDLDKDNLTQLIREISVDQQLVKGVDGDTITINQNGIISSVVGGIPDGGNANDFLYKTSSGTAWRTPMTETQIIIGTDTVDRTVSASDIKLGAETHAPVQEAPKDGSQYVRQGGAWREVNIADIAEFIVYPYKEITITTYSTLVVQYNPILKLLNIFGSFGVAENLSGTPGLITISNDLMSQLNLTSDQILNGVLHFVADNRAYSVSGNLKPSGRLEVLMNDYTTSLNSTWQVNGMISTANWK